MLTEYEAQKLVKERTMVSNAERQKLLREYHREPVWVAGVVLKCAACLAILVVIVAIGVTTDLRPATTGATAAGGATHQEHAAVADFRNDEKSAGHGNTTSQ